MPAVAVWLANYQNPNTRRAYRSDVEEFVGFLGIETPEDFRRVARAHLLAFRGTLETRGLGAATIRRKLSALSSLFDHLCNENAIAFNPVNGVSRPPANGNEGSTPAISDAQARKLLQAPKGDAVKARRDRAILATFLFHGMRRAELAALSVGSLGERQGVMHFTVLGKGSKTRYIPAHPAALHAIEAYLEAAGHGEDRRAPLFRPVRNNVTGSLETAMTGSGIYEEIRRYGAKVGIDVANGFCLHSLRATAATNALDQQADIAKVQEWLGHANISTTRLYDRRRTKPDESPTYRIRY